MDESGGGIDAHRVAKVRNVSAPFQRKVKPGGAIRRRKVLDATVPIGGVGPLRLGLKPGERGVEGGGMKDGLDVIVQRSIRSESGTA